MKDGYKIDKIELLEILAKIQPSYIKFKSKFEFGCKYYEVYFRSESDMNRAAIKLNTKKNTNMFGRIVEQRMNREWCMLYVIPFKVIKKSPQIN